MRFECITLHVTAGGYRISVASTNAEVLKWIRQEIQSSRPRCSISSEGQLNCAFDIANYEPLEVGWWLVKRLCDEGWEPFGTVGWEESWGLEFISLRKRLD